MISATVSDRSGRTSPDKPWRPSTAPCSMPTPLSFGLNCSLGAEELAPLARDAASWAECAVSLYPNAGLPNEMGAYDQTPGTMASQLRSIARDGLLNIAGGCCGTTPEHIAAIAEALRDCPCRPRPAKSHRLHVSGLEAVTIDRGRNFTNIAERTNVAGSRKFARLIASQDYAQALAVASSQLESGASVMDVNMDDAMLDSCAEMEKFLRHAANEPAVARAAVMVDSSHWDTVLAGLKNAQGKCIVNSISLKEGERSFLEKAREAGRLGAAVAVMAFDEKGQATDFARKTEICARAYHLLTDRLGFEPCDIILDPGVLAVGTGIPGAFALCRRLHRGRQMDKGQSPRSTDLRRHLEPLVRFPRQQRRQGGHALRVPLPRDRGRPRHGYSESRDAPGLRRDRAGTAQMRERRDTRHRRRSDRKAAGEGGPHTGGGRRGSQGRAGSRGRQSRQLPELRRAHPQGPSSEEAPTRSGRTCCAALPKAERPWT